VRATITSNAFVGQSGGIESLFVHSSIRIVERYVHPTAEHKKSAMLRYEAAQMARTQALQAERLN
jgi:hypothetical protein